MGRGVSAGGGQSSLGYLFGGGEPANNSLVARDVGHTASISPSPKPTSASSPLISRLQLEFMEILRQLLPGRWTELWQIKLKSKGCSSSKFYEDNCLMSSITSCDFFYFGD
uniref:SP1L5 n=1 Tax=Salix matsudana TaxID=349989 RepID=A0A167V9E5_9ROSI|nr:SP1L5 [Salix matsudana]QEH62723.1 SRP1 [Salix matsudana]